MLVYEQPDVAVVNANPQPPMPAPLPQMNAALGVDIDAGKGTVATIPWQVWVSVLSATTLGGSVTGYIASRDKRGAIVGGIGGLLSGTIGVLIVGTINTYGDGGFRCGPLAPPELPSPAPPQGPSPVSGPPEGG